MTTPYYDRSPVPKDPDAERCYICGAWLAPGEGVTCQGAIPDQCLNRMCDECAPKCACDLPVCSEHLKQKYGVACCANCEGDIELCDQPEAERLVMLAEAGCTVAEVRAFSREVGRG